MYHELEYEVISTKNGQTGYIALGDGPPLIMLVGYSGNLLHWNSEFIFQLATQFRVYLVDNRMVGLTKSTNTESINGLAQDTMDFIEALNLDSVVVCGWSMGGIIAQSLAIQFPDKVAGAVLIVSQPDYSYTSPRLHQFVTKLRVDPGRENRDKLMELFFSEVPSIEFRKYLAKSVLPIPGYVHSYNEHAQRLQDKAIAGWKADFGKLTALVTIPVLIQVAKNDLVTDPTASTILHQHITNSKLISYPSGGHFFMHSYPHQLAAEIIDFFAILN